MKKYAGKKVGCSPSKFIIEERIKFVLLAGKYLLSSLQCKKSV
jgi:hypothetical protein